jgi:hypothetical protein
VPPDITDSTSISSPVHQLISSSQSDGDSSGVGNVSRTVGHQMHGAIDVGFARCDRPLEFEKGGERLSVHCTLLH